MTPNRTVLVIVVLLGGGLLSGCGEDAPAAAPPPPVKKASAAPKAAAAPVDAPVAAAPGYQYAYNPMGKRDPFRAVDEQIKVPGADGDKPQCAEPLCKFDLEQLNLVAVVSGDANPLAMMEDPTNTGHLIRRNTRVGKQGGKVTQILRDCIIVTEYWQGPDGKSNPNPVKVCVKAEKIELSPVDLMNPGKLY